MHSSIAERLSTHGPRAAGIAAVIAAACTAMLGCSKSANRWEAKHYFEFLEKYGYSESVAARSSVEHAIDNCNLLISRDLAIRLYAAWPSQATPRPSGSPVPAQDNEKPLTSPASGLAQADDVKRARSFDPSIADFLNPTPLPTKIAIPVYLIRGPELGGKQVSFVPIHDKCIFVNGAGLNYMSELFHTDNLAARADRDAELALTLILLHEVGHIFNGDAGSFVAGSFPTLEEINGSVDHAKSRELKADLFAVDQVNGARSSWFPVTRLPLGAEVAAFVGSATFQTGMKRAEAEVGEMYLDKGDTHPNFYLRLLIMSYKMYPNPFSSDLLKTFLARREKTLDEEGDR